MQIKREATISSYREFLSYAQASPLQQQRIVNALAIHTVASRSSDELVDIVREWCRNGFIGFSKMSIPNLALAAAEEFESVEIMKDLTPFLEDKEASHGSRS